MTSYPSSTVFTAMQSEQDHQRSIGEELPIDEGADDGHLDYDDGDEDGLVLEDPHVYPANHLSEEEKIQLYFSMKTTV